MVQPAVFYLLLVFLGVGTYTIEVKTNFKVVDGSGNQPNEPDLLLFSSRADDIQSLPSPRREEVRHEPLLPTGAGSRVSCNN